MKRILWHLPYAMVGGVETLYATILKYIGNDYEHYVTCHSAISNWARIKYAGIAKLFFFTDVPSLANALKSCRPDLIVGTHGMTLYSALDHLKSKTPVVEIVHGSHIWVEHNVTMPKNWTQHIVCVSDSAREVYLNNSQFDIPTSVIINGVDPQIFYPRKPFSKTARVFAYFGRFLEHDKKITQIIKAFRALGTQHAKLYLIGGSPAEISSMKRFAKTQKLQDSINFYPHTEEPERYYKEIDICTVRSEAEGYCNSAAEALASGVPLVCYNFGGILRHVEEGTILVANSQQEYASHLNLVYKDAALRKSMMLKGLKFVQEKGNAKVMAIEYNKLFSRLLKTSFSVKENVTPIKTSEFNMPLVGNVSIKESRPVVGVSTPHWHGIYTATKAIVDICIPWERNHKRLAMKIAQSKPRAVLFSGMPDGFDLTAKELHTKYKDIPLYCYYHGGYSHYSFAGGLFGAGERAALQRILDLHKEGVFKKIAVSSPGFEQVCLKNKILAQFCGNIFPSIFEPVAPYEGTHIGNWNRHHDHKHTTIGIAASNLIDNAKLYMLACNYRVPTLNYENVQFYPEMSQADLYNICKKMTVNLQMSFIETFNISVLEMWALGTTVIVGPGNKVLVDGNAFLKEHCYVEDHTNPVEVASKIKKVQQNREKVVEVSQNHLRKLNAESAQRWREFFL